jgi:LacI family transcriptional regulator
MKTRVTQTDIARVARVHNTTVSLALRNSRLIPPATRDRIQAIAQSLGYQPDPALRALVAYRNSRQSRQHVEPLGYVTHGDTRWGWRQSPTHERHYSAVQRRAAELGYQVEHIWLGEEGMNPRRLDRMLLHGGITGLLLAPDAALSDELASLTWSRLTAVKIGISPGGPAVNQVSVDPMGVMQLALQRIRSEGYQRVGLVLPYAENPQVDDPWVGVFQAAQYRHASTHTPVPVLYLPTSVTADTSALSRWMRDHRPEVIVGFTAAMLEDIQRCGVRVPKDVAYVDLSLAETRYAVAGVWENCEKIGELAVELLVQQLDQNLLGLPAVPTVTSIGGVWRHGATLPERTAAAPSKPESAERGALRDNLVA